MMNKLNLQSKNQQSRKEKGITLIALIVTIIVLIILAGVAISMLSGQNGVINRASEARYSNGIAQFDERTKLAYIAVRSKIEADKVSNNGYIATKADNFKKIVEEVEKEFNVTAVEGKDTNGKIDTEGYTITYYLDTPVEDTSTDGTGYILIWYTDNSLRSSLNRDEAITKQGLKDIASNKSVNQAVLVRAIQVENYNSELSEKGLTSTTDSDNDAKQGTFKQTSLNDKLGFTSTAKVKQDRTRIEVGDYISYTPPTRSAYTGFTKAATGYGTENQTLPQEYTGAKWKVMKKYDDGSLDIVAVVTSENKTIGFGGAVGYNNVVFLLDDACSYLYANTAKGITARSMDYEDIERELVQNEEGKGQKKIEAYISEKVTDLKNNPGSYITNVDTDTNKITYKKSRAYYPLLYKKQANESEPYYSGVTTETKARDNKLTVEYTAYGGDISENDFIDYTGNTSNFYNTVFQIETYHWLATRCVYCAIECSCFAIHGVGKGGHWGAALFYSFGEDYNRYEFCVCPVVHLSSEIQVTVGTSPSETSGAHTVVIPK